VSSPDQYFVVAADGKEYGPADLETLRQWVREGRVVKATHIKKGEGPTTFAGKLPELADLFPQREASTDAAAGAPSSVAATVPLPADFRVWEFIGSGWNLLKPHWLIVAVIFLIQALIFGLPNLGIHYSGNLLQCIIGGPLMVGIWRVLLGVVSRRPPDVGMMFQGFDRFLDAFLAQLVMGILIFLGLICLIVPGVILAIMWMFTYPVIAETGLGFWEAMRESARLTEGYRVRLFLLILAFMPVTLLGALVCCVGVLVSAGVNFLALALVYRFLQARKGPPAAPATAPS